MSNSLAPGALSPQHQRIPSNPDPDMNSLAVQYSLDQEGIERSCFSKKDEAGNLIETYLTHIRITEDPQHPHSRPSSTQPEGSKKHRILIISVRHSGRVRIHKARQNPNSTFQIGKSWNMEDLSRIENDTVVPSGFVMTLGKNYYWCTHTPREKVVFINSAIRIFKKYTGGKIPELIGFENVTPPASPISPTDEKRRHDASPLAKIKIPHMRDRGASVSRQDVPRTSVTQAVPSQVQQHGPSSSSSSASSSMLQPQMQPPPPRQQQPQQQMPLQHQQPQSPMQPPPPRHPGSRKGSISQNTPGFNPAYNRSQDNFNIPNKSASRPSQIRRVESQPRLKTQPSRGQLSVSPSTSSLSQVANGNLGANLPASKSAGNLLHNMPSFSPTQPKQPEPPVQVPSRAAARSQPLGQQFQPSTQPTAWAPGQNSKPTQPQPMEPGVPTLTLNDSQTLSPLRNESKPEPRIIDDNVPRIITEDFDQSKPSDLTAGIKFGHSKRSSVQSIKFSRVHEAEPLEELETQSPNSSQAPEGSDKGVKFNVPNSQSRLSLADDSDTKEQERKSELMRSRMSFIALNNASVIEETLQELNWTGRSDVKTLELKISSEINSLEFEKLHNVVDLDDKLGELDESLELATKECERLDAMFAFFSVQLGSFSDNISLIEGQGQGLQVQTHNQKILWTELNNILHTVSLPSDVLNILNTHELRSAKDIGVIENVLTDLYKAVKVVRSSGEEDDPSHSLGNMKALKEKRHIYEQAANKFTVKVKTSVDQKVSAAIREAEDQIVPANSLDPTLLTIEEPIYKTLIIMSAVILFVKEIDELNYYSILRNYENRVKSYYEANSNAYFAKWKRVIGKAPANANNLFMAKQPSNEGYTAVGMTNSVKSSLKRSQTLAKIKSHTTEFKERGIDRNNSISVANSTIGTDTVDISVILTPTNIRPSIVKAIQAIRSLVVKEQNILIEVFHQSSFGGSRYPEFVKTVSISQRRIAASKFTEKVYNIDFDHTKAQDLLNLMTGIFSPVQDHLIKFIAEILEKSVLDCSGVITALDIMLKELQSTNLDFLTLLYQRLHDRVLTIWNHFIDEQVEKIGQTIINGKRRSGPVYSVRVFPLFCQRIEQDIAQEASAHGGIDRLPVRTLINDSYTKVGKAIISRLEKAKADLTSQPLYNGGHINSEAVADYEDKDLMNYHVLMIENMNLFCEGLEQFSTINLALKNVRLNALAFYQKELKLYIDFILHRPIGKLMDFLDSIEQVLRKNPDDNPGSKPGLSRSTLKKLLINFDTKELRKVVDTLYKRVEKHFTEEIFSQSSPANLTSNRKLIAKVWTQTETEFVAFVRKLRPYIEKYYNMVGDSGYVCRIDFSDDDIVDAFKMHGT